MFALIAVYKNGLEVFVVDRTKTTFELNRAWKCTTKAGAIGMAEIFADNQTKQVHHVRVIEVHEVKDVYSENPWG